jgi:S-adenosylmethionine:tRNA ribosyltransferase-isomerase
MTNFNQVKTDNIDLKDYNYDLPADRIAQYPAAERDMSQLLIYKENNISKDVFRNIDHYLPRNSLLVFNNTRVIRARIIFSKKTGATIEVLCLEPLSPPEYELSFGSRGPVEWNCIIGNLKKWKEGTLNIPYFYKGEKYELTATKAGREGEAWRIRFDWGSDDLSFGEIIDIAGRLPLPPYLEREAETEDLIRYQTVFSRFKGSVAAPTAGLHFTGNTLDRIKGAGIDTAEITLHVGAGTFKPVKAQRISDHEMHSEHFFVTAETIEKLLKYHGRIIAVGTTSARSLESLFWLGIKLKNDPAAIKEDLSLGQWDAYEKECSTSVTDAMNAILNVMHRQNLPILSASTRLMIIPGYRFRMIDSMITNFHQPGSTLLLLVSAFVGQKWKEIYNYALENNFRFLSYGDCTFIHRK